MWPGNLIIDELAGVGTCLLRCGSPDRLTAMRGDERIQDGMFSYVSLEPRVPLDHPLRGPQLDPAAAADGSTAGNAPGEVCSSNGCRLRG
jgi:hypothetical protein